MAIKTFIFENSASKEKRHAQVQNALREYTGIDSAEITYTSKGKPMVKGTPNDIYVSVTTADEVMVVAFSPKPIGIDGEHMARFENQTIDRKLDYIALAERFFSSDEAEYVRDGSAEEAERFAQIWVRKEAYVKYTGEGMSAFSGFSVTDGIKMFNKVNGVPVKKLNVVFPGSNEYIFMVASEDSEG